MTQTSRRLAALVAAGATLTATALAGTTGSAVAGPTGSDIPASGHYTTKTPTSVGFGGAVTSVDPEASRIGISVLKHGGNAVDAAVATAAALGVTEPYSSGLGGGGFFVYYDATSHRVHTIDGRETAPMNMPTDAFNDPATGQPYNFTPELVTSGVSVGVPGTPATWEKALRQWGTYNLRRALAPAADLARRGFVVDQTFHDQTADNEVRFEAYTTTPKLFLPGGEPPAVGSVLKNPDLADTYRMLGRKGMRAFYHGPIAHQIARLVRTPPKSPDTDLPVPAGFMTARDLARYRAIDRRPTHSDYRGLQVFGMAPPSSGGSTVGEALNILEQFDTAEMTDIQVLHHYLEATALAFADRGAYIGDPAFVDVPLRALLSDRFARKRACLIDPDHALPKPQPAQQVGAPSRCADSGSGTAAADTENVETTNLTVTDRWGNVVEYTLTIEQTGGSGMLVPGRGFLLNNELTDFDYSATYDPTVPNRIQPGKRPRSSMAPTILLRDGRPALAVGSPGGSTIITTVMQILVNRLDRDMTLPAAIADPRGSQRNTASISAEPAFISTYGDGLTALGHTFGTPMAEIGAATAIEFGRRGLLTAVSEPTRRGGGSALVVRPRE